MGDHLKLVQSQLLKLLAGGRGTLAVQVVFSSIFNSAWGCSDKARGFIVAVAGYHVVHVMDAVALRCCSYLWDVPGCLVDTPFPALWLGCSFVVVYLNPFLTFASPCLLSRWIGTVVSVLVHARAMCKCIEWAVLLLHAI